MAAVNQVEDCELLTRMGQARDREAFTELYDRLARSAFNLARVITSNSALAEEAVQEAFYRVWIFPSSFTGGGSARAWILQIVARESLKKIRTLRRERRDQEDGASRAVWKTAPRDPSQHDAEDRVTALRQALGGLPVLQQQLIGLYFGAGMSQHQIAKAVRLPARTVSHKLERALAQLRENLKRSGWTASLPLALETLLPQALWAGPDPASSLRERVLARANPALPARIEPLATGLGSRSMAVPGLLLGTLLLTGVLLSRPAPQPPAPAAASRPTPNRPAADPLPAQGLSPTTQPNPALPPPFKELFWDFKTGLPSDLEVHGAYIEWLRDAALGNGALKIQADPAGSGEKVQIFSPRASLRTPCLVEFKVHTLPHSRYSFGASFGPDNPWAGEFQTGNYRRAYEKYETTSLKGNVDLYSLRIYVLERGFLGFMDSDLAVMALHGLPKQADWDRLFFHITPSKGRVVIDDLRVRELPAGEVPLTLEQAQKELSAR